MPYINIVEKNLTRATGTVSTDIALIPGFCTEQVDSNGDVITIYDTPVFCKDVTDFEKYFGSDAPIVGTSVDPSYVMAKELLTAGMSIYYFTTQSSVSTIYKKNYFKGFLLGDDVLYLSTSIVMKDWGPVTLPISLDDLPNTITIANLKTDLDPEVYTVAIGTSDDIATITISIKSDHQDPEYSNFKTISDIRIFIDDTTLTPPTTPTESALLESYQSFISSGDFLDKDQYSFKYVTTGGYANCSSSDTLYTTLIEKCAARGDCIAFIEGTKTDLNDIRDGIFYDYLNNITLTNGTYGTSFIPRAKYIPSNIYKYGETKISEIELPACFAYLRTLASNIKTSPNWLAMAGTTRGVIPTISSLVTNTNNMLSNVTANNYQPTTSGRAINPITNIQPYGLTIWGNRTLEIIDGGLNAEHFLNIRSMICDIKKVAYRAAKAQLFEQNSEVLWTNFKADVSPFLDQLKAGYGISDYKLIKTNKTAAGKTLGKEEFACAIKIYPMYAVEAFDITISINDSDVAVNG